MLEILKQYAPWIVTTVAIISPILPVVIKTFNADKMLNKQYGIVSNNISKASDAIEGVKELHKTLTEEIKKVATELNKVKDEMLEVKDTVIKLLDSDLYTALTRGITDLVDLKSFVQEKNDIIEHLTKVIKDIHIKLGE